MNIAYYIAREGEAFSKFPDLCYLHEQNGIELGQNYRNKNACAEFVNSIGTQICNETKESVCDSRFLSVLCDGATDKSITEQEIVYIRYVDKSGKLNTKLGDIVDLEHGHAEGVKSGVLQALEHVGIS